LPFRGGWLSSVRTSAQDDVARFDLTYQASAEVAPMKIGSDVGHVAGQAGDRVLLVRAIDFAHVELFAVDRGSPPVLRSLGCVGRRESTDFVSGTLAEEPRFTSVGDVAVFAAADAGHGLELWRTDGTVEGTFPVLDLAPGPASSSPSDVVAWDDGVAFSADD